MTYAPGDVVRHPADDRLMTVRGPAEGLVECDWFEGHEHRRARFRPEELRPATRAELDEWTAGRRWEAAGGAGVTSSGPARPE